VGLKIRSVGASPDPGLLSEVQERIKPAQNICWKEGHLESDDADAMEKGS
jgi:hypothetical protein